MQKVMIIGCPGSGKSTFARALQAATGLPLYYLDMLYWNADKTTVSKEVFRGRLREILDTDAWILDGNHGSTMEMRLEKCDTVFFLDFPVAVCLGGIQARFGKPRADMPWVETEEDAEFLNFIKAFEAESKPKILTLLAQHPEKQVITFRSREESATYLQSL
ncbi:MAG: adenylate kinase [Clostridia bacterium]|nr:adenylate kinase [Clostridia bacterium]